MTSAVAQLMIGAPVGIATGLAVLALAGLPLAGLAESSDDVSPQTTAVAASPSGEIEPREPGRVESRATPAKPRETRYTVEPGDTLWSIAVERYRDVDGAMARIKKRNGFRRNTVYAGEVLLLPAPAAPSR